jgi:hypothetical protein
VTGCFLSGFDFGGAIRTSAGSGRYDEYHVSS